MEEIITVQNLTKRFGKFTAVNGISFNIKQGEIMGFLGPNGAGKTTTIKMLNGLLKISGGRAWIKGWDAEKERKKIKPLIGYMSQKFSLYPLLTARENIEFFGGISGLSAAAIRRRQGQMGEKVAEGLLNQKIADLPPGIKQQVALFVCLMTDPEIIFLDEPTSGVDPETRRKFWNEIYGLKTVGKTILVTTHNLDEAEYADRILIIHRGNLVLEGEPEQLAAAHGADSIETLFKEAIAKNETF
jgi:ABC-2 type transport system ATP-binding protein